jgi:hypothetical protein
LEGAGEAEEEREVRGDAEEEGERWRMMLPSSSG